MKYHRVEREIMWGDLDPLGIVFYPRYYEWIDGSGHLFFDSLGLNMGKMLRTRRLIFGLVETSSRYFAPGRYHDRLEICTCLSELNSKTLTLRHEIRRLPDQKRLLEGLEKRICLDTRSPDRLRSMKFPEDIRSILNKALLDTQLG